MPGADDFREPESIRQQFKDDVFTGAVEVQHTKCDISELWADTVIVAAGTLCRKGNRCKVCAFPMLHDQLQLSRLVRQHRFRGRQGLAAHTHPLQHDGKTKYWSCLFRYS